MRNNLHSRWMFGIVLGFVFIIQNASAYDIASFSTLAEIHEDSSATITETVVVDFGGEQRHGIYRDIPIHYSDRAGQHFKMRLRVLGVNNDKGRAWPYTLESPDRYQRIRIGSANRTITGIQTFVIRYEVSRGAVRLFPDHDEFYWNMTGNEWAVPMRQVHAEVRLPKAAKNIRAMAFVGPFGSTTTLDQLQIDGTRILFEPTQGFQPYEGLTVVVGWDKGAIVAPSLTKSIGATLRDNLIYGVPLVVLLFMIGLWYFYGKDPPTPESQVVEYQPPDNLTPAEIGTLIDEKVHMRDITSTVVDLATRGFLKIEPIESSLLGFRRVSDYRLTSLKDWRSTKLRAHEVTILKGIFASPMEVKKLSDLDQVFYTHLSTIRTQIYEGLILDGYFIRDPSTVRGVYITLGLLCGAGICFVLFALNKYLHSPPTPIYIVSGLSAFVVMMFNNVMPKKTQKGALAAWKARGFHEFLWRTDAERIRQINDPSLFEKCLPYAMAFGFAERWARAFEGLYTQPPQWYAGGTGPFSPSQFGTDLTNATSRMGQSFTSVPRSSGGSSGSWGGSGFSGGSSGGGGGGGGGGSW